MHTFIQFLDKQYKWQYFWKHPHITGKNVLNNTVRVNLLLSN